MKPASFHYHAPKTLADAVSLLAEFGDGAKVLAGGQSLIPMLAMRLTSFEHLVDIGSIAELQGIEQRNETMWVGAGTTGATIEGSPAVRRAVPMLAKATPLIGHFQIRNRGTVGGSIAHADPAAEYPAVALALDANMEVMSSEGRRTIKADGFFEGLWTTSMKPAEILIGVSFPIWSGRCGFAIEEFARRHGDFAIAGAALAVELDSNDVIERCALGLFGLGSTPRRVKELEDQLMEQSITDVDPKEVGHLAVRELGAVPSDLHGSADYRRRVGAAMTTRAWNAVLAEVRHG